ncbi:MAG TPA: hypothetical protein VGV61_01395 [Thermoanaerobaculia bacterium]|jgi:hypothetical protein|nr:hypothetical protein [Thermoanaerobaculia bacterium]
MKIHRHAPPRGARRLAFGLAGWLLAALPALAQAATGTVVSVRGTYDTWLFSPVGPLSDEGVLWLSRLPPQRLDLGLPAEADVDALEWLGGEVLFSVKDWTTVPGRRAPIAIGPADVVSTGPFGFTKIFSAAACGFPPGANVDALAALSNPLRGTDIYLSFDTGFMDQGVPIRDDDFVILNTNTGCSTHFATALVGMDHRLDVTGISWARTWAQPSQLLGYLTFDTWANVGGAVAAPNELLEHRVQGHVWARPRFDPAFVGALPAGELEDVSVQIAGFADGFETGDTSRWAATSP